MSRLFLPAATNLCANPSFELATAGVANGWTVGGDYTGTAVKEQVAGRLLGYAQHLAYTGLAGDLGTKYLTYTMGSTAVGTCAAGEVWTWSFYAKGSLTAGHNLLCYLQARNAAGNWLGNTQLTITPAELTSAFTRFSVTSAALPADSSRFGIVVQPASFHEGDVFDFTIDDMLLEKSSVLTPYFDGSSTDSLNASTYAWTGTANASTSTRTVSKLYFDGSRLGGTGTVAFRAVPIHEHTATGDFNYLSEHSFGGELYISRVSASAVWRIRTAADYAQAGPATFTAGSAHSIIGRWVTAATLDIMVDGSAGAQKATAEAIVPGTTCSVGLRSDDGASSARAYIGPLIFSPQRKPDAWVTAVDAILRSSAIDLAALKRVYMAPGDSLFTGLQADGSNLYVKGT